MAKKKKKALLYCRVSTKKQALEGHGLASQEIRLRERAETMGYEIVAVFTDDVSGGGHYNQRSGMTSLMQLIDAFPDERFVVLFDDLKRFARDTRFHLELIDEMDKRGVERECLNHKIDNSPAGRFIETILAGTGKLEREQNALQVSQKMIAHMQSGRWKIPAPRGYRYEKHPEHGKLITPVEPMASIIKEALEGYASGRFQTQAEVRRFLEAQPDYPKNAKGRVEQQRVTDMLDCILYAGVIDYPKWGISNVQGVHQALISLEAYEQIQERRRGVAKAPARKTSIWIFLCVALCVARIAASLTQAAGLREKRNIIPITFATLAAVRAIASLCVRNWLKVTSRKSSGRFNPIPT